MFDVTRNQLSDHDFFLKPSFLSLQFSEQSC